MTSSRCAIGRTPHFVRVVCGSRVRALRTPERAHFYKWLVWMTNTLQATLMIWHYPERWADSADAVAQSKS